MKNLILIIVLCLFYSSSFAKSEQAFIGKFSEIKWGDYPHIALLDDKGKEVEFWCGVMKGETLNCEELENNPSKYKGKKMKIYYHVVKVHVPEAQEEITKNETTKIVVLK